MSPTFFPPRNISFWLSLSGDKTLLASELNATLGELLSSCSGNKRKDCILVRVEPCAASLTAGFSTSLRAGRYHYFVVLVRAQLGDKGHLGNGEGEMRQSSSRGNENFHVLGSMQLTVSTTFLSSLGIIMTRHFSSG